MGNISFNRLGNFSDMAGESCVEEGAQLFWLVYFEFAFLVDYAICGLFRLGRQEQDF